MTDQLEGIPFINDPEVIRKYLAPSPATPKGRMRRDPKGLRSTRAKEAKERKRKVAAAKRKVELDKEPEQMREVNSVFCFAALADKQTGTMYTDQTGALPVRSLDGMQYFSWRMIMIRIISLPLQSAI